MTDMNRILVKLGIIAGIAAGIWAALQINHFIFRKIQKKRTGLQLIFFERVSGVAIFLVGIIVAFSLLDGLDNIWKSLLGGTAILSAVIAYVAQDALTDILSGLMISIYRPFEIGNRIELEDGTFGVVKDITMRHVVLQGIDTAYIVIPNSRINDMKINNYSYHTHMRSAQFQFHVAYGTDVKKAMRLVRQAIMESDYSVPGRTTEYGQDYGPVYFMAYENSSLRLTTTVYFEPESPTEAVMSDINLRVNQVFSENGIEIPYTYVNVIRKTEQAEAEGTDQE